MPENIVNCTPHDVVILDDDGAGILLPPSGCLPRVDIVLPPYTPAPGAISVLAGSYGPVTGLPERQEGTLLVVSALVSMCSQRDDLVVPVHLVRDDRGRVVGCRALARMGAPALPGNSAPAPA